MSVERQGRKIGSSSWLLGASLLLSVSLLTGCFGGSGGAETNASATPSIKQVKVEPAAKQKVEEAVERVGEFQASAQIEVIARNAGTISEIYKNRGETVAAGDPLFRIRVPEVEQLVQKAEQNVRVAQDKLAKAKQKAATEYSNSKREQESAIREMERAVNEALRNYNKARNDYDDGLVGKAQVDQAERDWKNAQEALKDAKSLTVSTDSTGFAEYERALSDAQQEADRARQVLGELTYTAQGNGIFVASQSYQIGTTVAANETLGSIQRLDPIAVQAGLSEEDVKKLRSKKTMEVLPQGASSPVVGTVNYISELPEAETKSYDIIVQIANSEGQWKPGMKAQLRLTATEDITALAVPSYSVVKDGDDTFVFVVKGDIVEKRKVQLGRVGDTYQEVLSGIQEGEAIVTLGQNQLRDQEKIVVAQ